MVELRDLETLKWRHLSISVLQKGQWSQADILGCQDLDKGYMQPYVHMTQWLGCHQQLIVHITEADSLLLLSMLYSSYFRDNAKICT